MRSPHCSHVRTGRWTQRCSSGRRSSARTRASSRLRRRLREAMPACCRPSASPPLSSPHWHHFCCNFTMSISCTRMDITRSTERLCIRFRGPFVSSVIERFIDDHPRIRRLNHGHVHDFSLYVHPRGVYLCRTRMLSAAWRAVCPSPLLAKQRCAGSHLLDIVYILLMLFILRLFSFFVPCSGARFLARFQRNVGGRPSPGPRIRPRVRPARPAGAEQPPGMASSITAESAPSVVSPLFDEITMTPAVLDKNIRQVRRQSQERALCSHFID